jgi:hypothetical protein
MFWPNKIHFKDDDDEVEEEVGNQNTIQEYYTLY